MENTVVIERAAKGDADLAAGLTLMAYKDLAYDIFGGKCEARILDYLKKLWIAEENRFSYQYSYIAKISSEPVGLITCYPGNLSKKLICSTVKRSIKIGKAHFLWHIINHLNYYYYFASTREAYPDEFYIGTLAVLPEYRSHGIGAKMIDFTKTTAKAQGFGKCSLLVEASNIRGIRFYERNGFKKVLYSEKPRAYFRMLNSFKETK